VRGTELFGSYSKKGIDYSGGGDGNKGETHEWRCDVIGMRMQEVIGKGLIGDYDRIGARTEA
jgi:hypothetical protein